MKVLYVLAALLAIGMSLYPCSAKADTLYCADAHYLEWPNGKYNNDITNQNIASFVDKEGHKIIFSFNNCTVRID